MQVRVVEVPMDVFEERLMCECGGQFRALPSFTLNIKPQQDHYCDSCGKHKRVRGEPYPRTTFRARVT